MRWLVLLALAAAAVLFWPPRAGRDAPLEWGLYQIHWGRAFPGALERELTKFASRPDYVMFYRDLARPYPERGIDAVHAHGAVPVISLELWHWHKQRSDHSLPGLAAGKFDDYFRAWARAAAADGRRVLLRFGFEMNGDWFTWSLRPELFVKAWRRARAIFLQENAAHVEWVWCPNVVSVPDTAANDMHLYYPGDAHVDWVALDGYNFGEHHDEWHRWESFRDVFDAALDSFADRYPRKPVMIGETASAPGARRAQWIREAFAYLQGRPEVRALVWFNLDKRPREPDWRIDATPESLRAFNETFARAR